MTTSVAEMTQFNSYKSLDNNTYHQYISLELTVQKILSLMSYNYITIIHLQMGHMRIKDLVHNPINIYNHDLNS